VSNLWFNYFWASIKGNGPEALVQTIVYGIIAILFVPPIRRWFKAEYDKVHAKIDLGHKELHAKLDHNARLAQHIIEHTKGIPNEDHLGNSLIKPREKL
jgi:hypothetical protein